LDSAPGSLNEGTALAALKIAARCFLVAFFVVKVAAPVADLDNWHEMALIRESLAAGHLLKTDVYAYTPTIHPVVDHEWGAGALLYFTVKAFGGWAVVLLKYLVALLTGAAVLYCARLRRTGFEELTVLTPLVIPALSLGCATLRAQAYSFLFFAVLLCLLELDSAGNRRWIAIWMAVVVLWVNMHGGVVIGIITLGLYWVERVVRRKPHLHILGVIALSVAALSCTPYGLAYFSQLWGALRMQRPEITEWYGIVAIGAVNRALFWATLAIAVVTVLMRGWRECSGALILAAMAVGTILHSRIIPFYAVAWAAYVPSYASATPLGKFIGAVFRNRMAVAMVCMVLTMFFAVMAFEAGVFNLVVPNSRFPVGAVRYLKQQNFRGNVMTHFEDGGYVSWWMYPAVKVFVDSRYETAFPSAVVDESFRFYKAEADWRQILEKYPTDLVITPISMPVTPLMPTVGWSLIYQDDSFQIYAHPGLQMPFRDESGAAFPASFP
jgi:hypothetical protein